LTGSMGRISSLVLRWEILCCSGKNISDDKVLIV